MSVRRLAQRVEDLDRAQVRVEPERLANAEKPLLGTRLRRVGRVPLGSADRREQHRVGSVRRLERRLRQRRAGRIDRSPAEKRLGELEAHAVPRADDAEDLDRLGGDLGADAVARQQADSIRVHASSNVLRTKSVSAAENTTARSMATAQSRMQEGPLAGPLALRSHARPRN